MSTPSVNIHLLESTDVISIDFKIIAVTQGCKKALPMTLGEQRVLFSSQRNNVVSGALILHKQRITKQNIYSFHTA